MIRILALIFLATPALADDLPFKVGDFVVETYQLDGWTGDIHPNPLPEGERACFLIESISSEDIWLRLQSGYYDMNGHQNPEFDDPGLAPHMPTQAPIGTGTGFGSSEGIWAPCEEPDPTGMTTVSTTCNMQRLYDVVPDCSGRPLPPE